VDDMMLHTFLNQPHVLLRALLLQVEDAAVANSIRMLEVHASSGSMGSDLSDASSATQYARSPSPLAMAS
jgi:hypothetical protein